MKSVDTKSNPGLAKLPTEVRNKMGYMKKGGMASEPKKMMSGGMAMKHGGMTHSDMAKDKPMMKKVAAKAVKGHEKKMHGMKSGGMAVKKMVKGGGIEVKGKTKGAMVKMKKGGSC